MELWHLQSFFDLLDTDGLNNELPVGIDHFLLCNAKNIDLIVASHEQHCDNRKRCFEVGARTCCEAELLHVITREAGDRQAAKMVSYQLSCHHCMLEPAPQCLLSILCGHVLCSNG